MANPLDPPHEFEAGGNTYRARRIDAMTQWHIVRRLSPLAASMTSLAATMSAEPADSGEEGNEPTTMTEALMRAIKRPGAGGALELAAKTLADMSDADSEYIMNACLRVCDRKAANGGAWVPVWNSGANISQFSNMNMGEMLRITVEVLKDSLGGFFPEILSALNGAAPQ